MNITSLKETICPSCSSQIEYRIFHNVNATNDPELKQMILNNTFFKVQCPSCKTSRDLLHPFLYHDMRQKYMIYYAPFPPNSNDENIHKRFRNTKNITKRIVYTTGDLKEKILIFDIGLSDFVLNLLKILIIETRNISSDSLYSLYFYGIEKNHLKFQLTQNQKQQIICIPYEEYKIAIEIVGYNSFVDNDIFSLVDIDLAQSFLNSYKQIS